MPRYRFEITLEIEAPVLSRATGAMGIHLDCAAFRDTRNRPALPGTLLRGNIRHRLEEIRDLLRAETPLSDATRNEADKLAAWIEDGFGRKSTTASNEPERGTLQFSYFFSARQTPSRDQLYRIAIDDATGVAARGAYQVIESPFAPGSRIAYSGCISREYACEKEAGYACRWLKKALQTLPAAGAFKGIGFGKILSVNVERTVTNETPQQPPARPCPKLGLRIRPEGPVCFAKRRYGNNQGASGELYNLFQSEDHIPGSAILAMIATRLIREQNNHRGPIDPEFENSAFPTLRKYFNQLRVLHAFPVTQNRTQRPAVLPLSLVSGRDADKNIEFVDVLLTENPGMFHGRAADFQSDWKPAVSAEAGNLCGWEAPPRRLEVYTAINPGTGSSMEHELYSYETLVPDAHEWLTNLYLPAECSDADHLALQNELYALFARPLDGFGKTGTSATVQIEAAGFASRGDPNPLPIDGNPHYAITLQTPFRLLEIDDTIAATNGGEALFEAYKTCWSKLSGNSLELVRFFARQELAGGDYWWRRFRGGPDNRYQPELHTAAGSVFLLRVTDPGIAPEKVSKWLKQGLPPSRPDSNWRDDAFTPLNGYGEIAVNLPWHGENNALNHSGWESFE